jgi:hypothetical protein
MSEITTTNSTTTNSTTTNSTTTNSTTTNSPTTNMEENTKENTEENTKEQDVQCSVCYTELNVKNCVITPCNHPYCTTCFFTWLDKKETCAMCRRQLLNDDVVKERAENLQEVQHLLTENYSYLRALDHRLKRKQKKVKILNAQTVSLQSRQIRLRMMLDNIREASKQEIKDNKELIKQLKKVKKNKKNKKEYMTKLEDIYAESDNESNIETEEEEEEESFTIIQNMEEMLVAESYLARAERSIQRERRAEVRASRLIMQTVNEETEGAVEETEGGVEETEGAVEDTAAEEAFAMGFDLPEETAEEDEIWEFDAIDHMTENEDTEGTEYTEEETEESEETEEVPRRILHVPRRNEIQSPIFRFGAIGNTPQVFSFTPSFNVIAPFDMTNR